MNIKELENASRTVTYPARRYLVEVETGCLAQQHVQIMAENDDYIVLRAMADQIPNTLYEIGRLREEALPENEETSERCVDLDYFDLYYLHLVIWNKANREIAGACRIGQTDIILKRFGHNGLFTGASFHYSPAFLQETGPALEIGKFFIKKEYRGRRSPVMLLCKGIGYFISYNPHYKALIGPVSIGNRYSLPSQQLILSFLKKNTYAPGPARLVEPLVRQSKVGPAAGAGTLKTRLKEVGPLSRFVSGLEKDGKGVPRDVSHYVKLGGKLIGVSAGYSVKAPLTGLMLMDLAKLKRSMLKRFMGGGGFERFFDYHGGRRDRAA
jgi:hypothetical protein